MDNFLPGNVKHLRQLKGWTQEELADKLGVVKSRISSYEAGRSSPRLEGLLLLAQLFEVGYDDLISRDLKKQAPTGLVQEPDPAIYRVVARLQRQLEEAEEKLAAQPSEKNIRELKRIKNALIQKYPDTARELGITKD